MSKCDECRRGFMQAALRGLTALLVPGCGAGRSAAERPQGAPDTGADDGTPQDDGGSETTGEGGAGQPTGTRASRTPLAVSTRSSSFSLPLARTWLFPLLVRTNAAPSRSTRRTRSS